MLKTRNIVFAVLTSLCISSSFAAAPKPAPGFVSLKQTQQIQAGQSKDEVIQMFGKPVATPKWSNGTSSLVYKTEDTAAFKALLYVDFDTKTGSVISSVIRPDDNSGMGSDSSE
ncbi:hypothetical protein [Uliginosibacterium sp. TH139]|uniref:hypothetical protein n=1 Tax=Uliginosibacterium sp. TH139 TaxID=2067453 RepID=UPI000C7CDC48|nr:hypothetical protein [Uliginosibacterium sp. TH139]PLK49714.1 hypothetical protein C0V76_04635 [Uliginosibacterium sp. TH139]